MVLHSVLLGLRTIKRSLLVQPLGFGFEFDVVCVAQQNRHATSLVSAVVLT